MQPVRNEIAYLQGDNSFSCSLEVIEGFPFIHLSMETLTPSLLKKMRVELQKLLELLQTQGYDVLFAHSMNKQTTKFCEMLKPTFVTQQLEDGSWLSSWLTFEDD